MINLMVDGRVLILLCEVVPQYMSGLSLCNIHTFIPFGTCFFGSMAGRLLHHVKLTLSKPVLFFFFCLVHKPIMNGDFDRFS